MSSPGKLFNQFLHLIVLGCRKFKTDVRDKNNPNMLDIAGWSADIKRIIQAFGKDLF